MHRTTWWGRLALGLALAAGSAATGQDEPTPTPTPAAVERAHQLFNGTWQVVELTDNGEKLGLDLVRAKLARDGRVRFANRALAITNPETGETQTSPIRLNPAALPRRLDLTNRNDQIQEGIYQIQGDELTICIADQPGPNRPFDFSALSGSGNMLARLKFVPDPGAKPPAATTTTTTVTTVTTAPAPKPAPAPALTPAPAATAPPALTATVATEPRRPTAAELRAAHDLLSGDWTVLSIVDDGETLGPELIRQRVAENGKVRFTSNTATVFNPVEDRTRTITFRVNPAASPSQIDVNSFDTALKGIYAFDGDILQICVAKFEDGKRPTDFTASPGSLRRLFRLRLAPRVVVAASTPPPVSAAELERRREEEVRGLIAGRWVLMDANGQLNLNFRPDGTFVAQRQWAKGARGLLGPKSDTSEGRWMFQNSRLSAQVSTTTDRKVAGTLFGVHVVTIGPERMVTTDGLGISRTLVKAP
jgi:uncharacterized protein (TIGR03067 family)